MNYGDLVKLKEVNINKAPRDFPGGPVAKTMHFQCRGHGFDPWLGSEDPTCLVAKKFFLNNKGEIKTVLNKRKLNEFIASREALNEMTKFHIFR